MSTYSEDIARRESQRFADLERTTAEFERRLWDVRESLEWELSEAKMPLEHEPAQPTYDWPYRADDGWYLPEERTEVLISHGRRSAIKSVMEDVLLRGILILLAMLPRSPAKACKYWALALFRLALMLVAMILIILYATHRLGTATVGTWAAAGGFLATALMVPAPKPEK